MSGHSQPPILTVDNLKTYFFTDEGLVRAVDGASFAVRPGKTVGIVGESGCGKSVTALSILRIVQSPGRVVEGEIRLRRVDDEGKTGVVDLVKLDDEGAEIRAIRGDEIALVFQEPMTSFSPHYTIGNQIIETILLHQDIGKAEARDRSIELLRMVGIPRPERRIDEYPFELSGGLRQRVMIAMALSCNPRILIADEPTTALDVTTQAQILDLLREIQARTKMSVIIITHDMGVIAEMADDVIVMYLGRVVESGPVDEIFHQPKHPYTRALLRSIPSIFAEPREKLPTIAGSIPHPHNRPPGCPFHPRCADFMPDKCDRQVPQTAACRPVADGELLPLSRAGRGAANIIECAWGARSRRHRPPPMAGLQWLSDGVKMRMEPPILEVRNLKRFFPIRKGLLRRVVGQVRAVDGVSLHIQPGETLSLVGESGCGKTTTARCILRALKPTAGEVLFRTASGEVVDTAGLPKAALKPFRHQMQMIFQDPFSSLNPRMTVFDIIAEPLLASGIKNREERRQRVEELLELVRLRPEFMQRFPHAFSGGQRQRIGIARALALNPSLIVADEPVSALDVSVQAQILNLMLDLQDELGLTCLFVAHDLSVVKHISDRVAVMYVGKIVEIAETKQLFDQPKHPYTEALLSAVPKPDPRRRSERIVLQGEVADPAQPPTGCYFHPRCSHAIERCRTERPPLEEIQPGHVVACHRAREISLKGVGAQAAV